MSSYMDRLADANRLDTIALRRHVAGRKQARVVPLDRLAIVTGVQVLTLERAIADPSNAGPLRKYHAFDGNRSIMICPLVSGLACRLCTAARGTAGPVTCWRPAEKVVCLRHRQWIGSAGALQPSLDRQPDVLKAHRQHLRLVRRFGRDEVTAAFTIADEICRHWHDGREHDEDFSRRLEIFHGPDWQVPPYAPTVAAAAYPQVVPLTRLLASPYWKSLAIDPSPKSEAVFGKEVRGTVAPAYLWPQHRESKDPLYRWLIGDVQFGTRRRRTAPSASTEPWMVDGAA
jgi:hypothetical protein